ncbi:hypothetical protein [Candidatus Cardinium hertigii]|nr:hypothetical protein [Candidatus Cardinium hertigii]
MASFVCNIQSITLLLLLGIRIAPWLFFAQDCRAADKDKAATLFTK